MQTRYTQPRSIRREGRREVGRTRGGKLTPVMAVPFLGSESGVINQKVFFELDPIPGRLLTPITAEVVSVYVPILAAHALKHPTDDFPGNAEVFRQKLLKGEPVFGLEGKTDISRRLGIQPRKLNGAHRVSQVARLAHNCAVNFLRREKYVKAELVDKDNLDVTPAILGQTVLDRLNGVLDPEDRVNGAVNLDAPYLRLPVRGLGIKADGAGFEPTTNVRQTGVAMASTPLPWKRIGDTRNADSVFIQEDGKNKGWPKIEAILDPERLGKISLTDFYEAERMDALTREMRDIVDKNPQYGEELAARFAYGLSVDVGAQPFVLYRKQKVFGASIVRAMDGPNLDKLQTNTVQEIGFTVPVPPTEFGGVVVTFISIKPDEALARRPHPILTEPWAARNYVADELALDPVPVTIRDIHSNCATADEETVAFYVGNNHLYRNYSDYGFSQALDTSTVEYKSAIWQLQVPMSVTPQSVIYPDHLNHYPFADQNAEVCTYTVSGSARIDTPMIFGPTPVEELAEIETANIFEDAEV